MFYRTPNVLDANTSPAQFGNHKISLHVAPNFARDIHFLSKDPKRDGRVRRTTADAHNQPGSGGKFARTGKTFYRASEYVGNQDSSAEDVLRSIRTEIGPRIWAVGLLKRVFVHDERNCIRYSGSFRDTRPIGSRLGLAHVPPDPRPAQLA